MDDVLARQLAQNIAFNVEAVPQEGASPTRNGGNMTPVNVKIRVRKKGDKKSPTPKGLFMSKPGQSENPSERLRLASSDHTILSFNMMMESDERKRKSRKNTFFGSCLGAQPDDDDGPYLPSTDSRSESFGKGKYRNTTPNETGTSQALIRKNTNFFGVCKPGGCLDPPYGEDRYAYQPSRVIKNEDSKINKETRPIATLSVDQTELIKTPVVEDQRDTAKLKRKEPTDKDTSITAKAKDEDDNKIVGTKRKSSGMSDVTVEIKSSTEQDRSNKKIEKLKKVASSSRSQSNEFNTLFFSPPKRDSSKDSGRGRRDSMLEERRKTLETVKIPNISNNNEDKEKRTKPETKVGEKTVSGKQISSAPMLILSDITKDKTAGNIPPAAATTEKQEQHYIPLTLVSPRGDEDTPKKPVSSVPLISTDKQKQAQSKDTEKDAVNVIKRRKSTPQAPGDLSDIVSSDVVESQHEDLSDIDMDKRSVRGSLVLSPITEIIIPPVAKTIQHSQTEDAVKKSEIVEKKEPNKLNGDNTENTKTLHGTEKKDVPHKSKILPTEEVQALTAKSDHVKLVGGITTPSPLLERVTDKKEEPKATQKPVSIADSDKFVDSDEQFFDDKTLGLNNIPDGKRISPNDSTIEQQLNLKLKHQRDLVKEKEYHVDSDEQLFDDKTLGLNNIPEGKRIAPNDGTIEQQLNLKLKHQRDPVKEKEYHVDSDEQLFDDKTLGLNNIPDGKRKAPNDGAIEQQLNLTLKHQRDPVKEKEHHSEKQDKKTNKEIEIVQNTETKISDEPKITKLSGEKTNKVLDGNQEFTKADSDLPYINLAFQKYTVDNKIGIKTLDADTNITPNDNIVTYKSMKSEDKEITIPIDGQNVMAIKIRKSSSFGAKDENKILPSNVQTQPRNDEFDPIKRITFDDVQKDYIGDKDIGFELSAAKGGSPTKDKYDNEPGVISSKPNSTTESRRKSNLFDEDSGPENLIGDLKSDAKLSKLESQYSNRGSIASSNKRNSSFLEDQVNLIGEKNRNESKVTSPTRRLYKDVKRDSTGEYKVETLQSPKWVKDDDGRRYSKNRKSDDSLTYSYKQGSVKSFPVSGSIDRQSIGSVGKRFLFEDKYKKTDLEAETFSLIPKSDISDLGKDSLDRKSVDSTAGQYFMNDYDNNNYARAATSIDSTDPLKRIDSFASRSDSKPTISSFRQTSKTGSKQFSLDRGYDDAARSQSNYEKRSDSVYGINEIGSRIRSFQDFDEAIAEIDKTDATSIDETKYKAYFETSNVGSFIDEKSGRSSEASAFYPFVDDTPSFSKKMASKGDRLSKFDTFANQDFDKRLSGATHSRSRSVDHDDAYRNKRLSYEEGDRRGDSGTRYRSVHVNTDIPDSKRKVVKYTEDEDSRIEIIGREINRTLSFIYEHELIPLQNVIKGLKEDIDVLASQQVLLREKLQGPRRVRPVRKCGCFKRYEFCSIME